MPLLKNQRCLQCSGEIDLTALWEITSSVITGFHTNSGNFLQDTCGIACPSCGMKHRISQARSGMVLLIVLAVWIGVMIATAKLVDGRFIEAASTAWSAGFVGIIFLHRKLAARLCRLRAITSGDIVVFPLELYLKAAKEEEEFEYEAAAELVEVQAAMAANTKDWICSHCREENPANFLDCWNCKTTRTET